MGNGDRPGLFRFTTSDLGSLYVAIMAAFEESAVLAPALNIEQVGPALVRAGWDEPIDEDLLGRALAALTGWRRLEATQDHGARFATPEEFERKNLLWALTPKGEAAVTGMLRAVDALRQAVGLQTAVLDAIGDGLTALAELAGQPRRADVDAKIHLQLAQVEQSLESLVVSVRQFNGHLQRLLRDDGTDDDVFADVKRRTVTYLEEYVQGVERPERRLATCVDRLAAAGVATLFDRALTGANLAPVSGDDPGPAWLAERARRWRALRAWFAPEDASAPLVAGLLETARTAVIELLRVLERRWDSRRRSASIAHDFRRLAGWFISAPGEEEAHRLYGAAFGLWSARHAHLPSIDGQERALTTTWAGSEPVEVAPSLRTTGTLTNRGRTRPVGDPSIVRAARQRAQVEQLAAHDALRFALVTPGAVPLSRFGQLDLA
ncbi:MAG: TIGR02677 family protein, partial [Micrococcales bacterium]|nr:TIGR02677 family protein [Micrococcales bacterium]